MAPPPRTNVAIKLIDPRDRSIVHKIDRWQSYQVSQGIKTPGTFEFVPSDTDSIRKIFSGGTFQKQWFGGWVCEIEAYGARIFTGVVDEPSDDVSTTSSEIRIAGRSNAGLLIDGAIRPENFNLFDLSLLNIAKKLTSPWRSFIREVITDFAASRFILQGRGATTSRRTEASIDISGPTRVAKASRGLLLAPRVIEQVGQTIFTPPARKTVRRTSRAFGKSSPFYRGISADKLQVKLSAGNKVWSTLERFSKHIASHLWMTPEGDLILARPAYKQATDIYGRGLVLRWSDLENKARGDSNVLGCRLETTIANRHSEYLVLGSGANKKTSLGRALIRKTWTTKDPSPAFWERSNGVLGNQRLYKPETIEVKRLSDEKLVRRIARTQMEEAAINSISYEFQAQSHLAETGALWAYDSMTRVLDERHGIEDAFYIHGRDLSYDLNGGEQTTIKLWPPGVWLGVDHDAVPGDRAYEKLMVDRIWW